MQRVAFELANKNGISIPEGLEQAKDRLVLFKEVI